MLLFLLTCFCSCSVRKTSIVSFISATSLSSFGFDENGTFEFDLYTPNQTTIIILLTTFNEMRLRLMRDIGLTSVCLNKNIHISAINSSFFTNVTHVHWKGTINSKNIYYPYIINCNFNKTYYTITTNNINPNSHLDFRDELYSLFYLLVSILYSCIAIVWIINSLFYPSFGILLHTTLACVATTKAIVSALDAKIWVDRRSGIVNYDYHGSYIYNLFFVLHYTAFLSIPTMIMAGWCILRDTIPFVESSTIIISSFVFVTGIWSMNYIGTIKEALFSMCLTAIGFLCFIRNNTDYIMMLGRLDDVVSSVSAATSIAAGTTVATNIRNSNIRNNIRNNNILNNAENNIETTNAIAIMNVSVGTSSQLNQKLTLLMAFASTIVTLLISLVIGYSVSISFEFWKIFGDCIIELCFLVISLFELYLFLFRQQYSGDFDDDDGQVCEENQKICFLKDPIIDDIAILKTA
ncbi:hypothetical protein TRFO_17417 [Tritrichomonas foetus]|uniref:Intimal thickness related receptor IRP domain-containing protein n=1 Tax=Tritrichomonas foetus TaxID=1144522 RepID=A0A1J4KNJ2_9EUKA|nr:hypothetical protein TRFO_17417 [Tritrichomonas foetus]|eukprot:OHT12698.1 hypothetical protein TRFO_17417 [Tritrichomonas foetus]